MHKSFSDYCKTLSGKVVALLGIGVSNTPLVRLLAQADCTIHIHDRKSSEDLGDLLGELESLGAKLHLGKTYLDHIHADVIFRSPGIRPDVPQIAEAVARGAVLTSEMDVFLTLCPCPIIAVTGSDGKTTTTTIIAEILQHAGHTVHLGGNIGRPLLPIVDEIEKTDICVLELSSFQLMTMGHRVDIAMVTNMSENHLDVHTDMDEYIRAKENIYLHQSADDLLVTNLDNEITRKFIPKAKGRVIPFSRTQVLENGFFLQDNTLWMAEKGKETAIIRRADIALPGIHNVDNFLAAFAATRPFAALENWQHVAETFPGVAHRIEFVRELGGVRYYNDSIASTPARTTAGLRSFEQKVILIAGGYDKKIPFDDFGEEIVLRVKHLILTGHTAGQIEEAVTAAPNGEDLPIVHGKTMEECVRAAKYAAEPGDIVLLSPACASFDQYENFAQRGDVFRDCVLGL